ncbi:GH116 family glycosyl hydrolase [Mucilaginibacter sp. dw_454]|uniref:GH116 family glycosyl hydrolase n=1 Tax=Mucilaginibacter sp. dw_454 TaxID=2720079 RepID=UPI001BD3BBAF|nr:GH116 family glycosyl hydrolase [Mucilaginibacter sp. dw_454]
MRKLIILFLLSASVVASAQHRLNTSYSGTNTDHIAFPIGGIGAGMFCLEGTGTVSNFSIFHNPAVFNEPPVFATLSDGHKAKVIEGPVPNRKKFGAPNAAMGVYYTTWGLPRFRNLQSFQSRFPFGEVKLNDKDWPVQVKITGWSPFIPTDQDNSGLPAGALEYAFTNNSSKTRQYTFSYSAKLFNGFKYMLAAPGGFIFRQPGASLAIFTDDAGAQTDRYWYRGEWVDPMTVAWKHIQQGMVRETQPQEGGTGATISVPVNLKPHESKTVRVLFCWYVPNSNLRLMGEEPGKPIKPEDAYRPWYSSMFKNMDEVIAYWKHNYNDLKHKTELFTKAFYSSTLPPEVTEAVAANLSILKSPTILRQYDGRFWAWEGGQDNAGSCPGSCTHVWNYDQALPHLFPQFSRSLRENEFNENQDSTGHQMFRTALPIRPAVHNVAAAADGQLGGIIKTYRDWRISGDDAWLKKLYPKIKQSLDYCIKTWDPTGKGIIEEPHHNTYDIEFWGPEPMCTGMYLGALEAFIQMSAYLKEDNSIYQTLYVNGKHYLETNLYNGSYFQQHIQWTGLQAPDPLAASKTSLLTRYAPDDLDILQKEGPKYQYGSGCLSDGMIGPWLALNCGLPSPINETKVRSHLQSVYNNNFHTDLSEHSNPQRVTYAIGKEGGVLLCTWPKGDKPSLPFTHSDEVWSGIEYEVASHLIFEGKVSEGLNIVKAIRKRYDGSVRNPYDEYECGHWYARALASYALIEALTGVRYDAVTQTLFVNSKVGDFTSFLSTDTGFGNVRYKNGKASLNVVYGKIEVKQININKRII